MTISEDDDGWHAPVSQFPTGSFRPGRVIWAKVEGHDWWPARVVRRRAVPREVGPPPGGPGRVRTQIPVVFFTAKGIPGEVSDEKQPSTPSGTHATHPLSIHPVRLVHTQIQQPLSSPMHVYNFVPFLMAPTTEH